ncbi:ion channel [Ichthyenterobacterium sp. W332]|uniref:Ion channel n=1 Tax=Microcosmobacter mediterraneus TaxID=3075607 RepID=A0ABU2YLK0_9FLAO|nr:ion channel [Ichthyenterobacterium sp. W332]MDT0559026.1 ion channel [Ichthyenterobacterium sp. W332]
MIDKLYTYRFELFLFTQLFILFGSLIIPIVWFEYWVMPIFLLLNIAAGVLLVSKKKRLSRILFLFVFISVIGLFLGFTKPDFSEKFNYLKLVSYFIFYAIVTIEIIKQVWNAKVVSKNVILGLISGYISLGLLAFFLCLSIEILYPESFSGLVSIGDTDMTERLMYFSYITLMTIGYGDILPVTSIAQKATMFIGLIGQFYLVILTAIVVGKYINQKAITE